MRHNCATHRVIEIVGELDRSGRASRRSAARAAAPSWLDPAPWAARGAAHDDAAALMSVAVRAVHVHVVRVVVVGLGVVQLLVGVRSIVSVRMHVSVLMVMRVAVGMLVHHVAMTVGVAMAVRVRVGVAMLVRVAVRRGVPMAMLVLAVGHFGSP